MGLVVMKAGNPIPPLQKKKLGWLGQDVDALRSAVELCNLNHVPQMVRKVIKTEAWREFWLNMKVYEFKTFREFITTSKHEGGCGWEPKYVEALVRKSGDLDALKEYRKAITRKRGGQVVTQDVTVNGYNVTIQPKRGNDLAYTLDVLERERKDLFDKVCAGEMSANAAAIEAGFRKRLTPFETVLKHVKLSPELIRALEALAARQGVKPETIIAESVRAYLGVDA